MALNLIKHKNVLIKILKDIFINPKVRAVLGFKGGTAAYLFYDLNRFSVGLDFDLLDPSKQDYVFEEVKKILALHGDLKEAKQKQSNLFYLLSYENKDLDAQNVKVEINLRDFQSKYGIRSYLGISMKVMTKEDMTAHKLVALYERMGRANRDLFDVEFFLRNNWPVNKEMIENRTGLSYKEFLKQCIESLEKKTQQNLLNGLGELLNEKQKDWVRTKLKSDTLFSLKLILDNE